MLLFFIKHGDSALDADTITHVGQKQSEALAKRLALFGIDKVYSSTAVRARLTAQYTSELVKKEAELLDFCNESHAWNELTLVDGAKRTWIYDSPKGRRLLSDSGVRSYGYNWYNHPLVSDYNFGKGMERIATESDKFFASLGFMHDKNAGKYAIVRPNIDRIALFAHEGFGMAFLSHIMDIPYPIFAMNFDMCHTGMTVIEFKDEGGFAIPKILTLSNDSHLYKEGLPTNYNNRLRF